MQAEKWMWRELDHRDCWVPTFFTAQSCVRRQVLPVLLPVPEASGCVLPVVPQPSRIPQPTSQGVSSLTTSVPLGSVGKFFPKYILFITPVSVEF